MTKKLCIILFAFVIAIGFSSCGHTSTSVKSDNTTDYSSDYSDSYSGDYGSNYNSDSYSDDYKSSYDSDYDYDKGYGYTSPKPGESLSDYIKREDPELYNDMKDRYDSLK